MAGGYSRPPSRAALSTETETIYRRYQAILERLGITGLQRNSPPIRSGLKRSGMPSWQPKSSLRLSSLRGQSQRYGLRMNPRGYSIVPGPILHNLPPIRPAATVHEERARIVVCSPRLAAARSGETLCSVSLCG